jgi:hypothetical protein
MTIDELRSRVLAAGFTIAADNTISPRACSVLLGLSEKSLRNRRSLGQGPDAIVAGRVRYALDAVWLFLAIRRDGRRRAA